MGVVRCSDRRTSNSSHPLIVPGASYAIQAIGDLCSVNDEDNYSADLHVATSRSGDILPICTAPPCRSPDGRVGINDVLAVLSKFATEETAPIKARVDLEPAFPDRLINMLDVLTAVEAFSGVPFSFAGSWQPCP